MMRTLKMTVAAGLWLAGCGSQAEDARNPMGSQGLITSQDYKALYVANAEEGSITRVDAVSMQTQETELPGEPTRLARIDHRVFASLRTERCIVELTETADGLQVGRRVDVGAEPYGLVASEDGTRLYVAVSMGGEVKELDGQSLEVLRVWKVEGEPRWLALHPSGQALYVGGAMQGSLHYINLSNGEIQSIELPAVYFSVATAWVPEQPNPVRITGDLAASPDGQFIAVPTLHVDNEIPIADTGGFSSGSYYGGPSRLKPGIAMIPVNREGQPELEEISVFRVSHFSGAGYLASLAFSPSSDTVIAAVEGAGVMLFLPTLRLHQRTAFGYDMPSPSSLFPDLFEQRGTLAMNAGAGPRAMAFTSESEGFVYTFLDRELGRFDLEAVERFQAGDWVDERPIAVDGCGHVALETRVKVTDKTLPAEVEAGRRLFYATNDPQVSLAGSGVSCATCHFDGRTDGTTWMFTRGLRQTPSLAGLVSAREPLRWQADRATVAADVLSTSEGMGGRDMTEEQAEKIAAFIDYSRPVDLPLAGSDDPAIERGREIFNRQDVGCADCHSGALFTDKLQYTMFGFDGVKTPSLLGVAATAPYLHDGSMPDLRTLLEAMRGGAMGDTSSLSDAELDDLEAFLSSI